MTDPEALKKEAAEKAVSYIKDGMVVGLGTGSTAKYAIEAIARLVESGYNLVAVATSVESERLARSLGIRVDDVNEHPRIDLTIDGADEIDPYLNLIKGLGGALLREKLVASCTADEIIIADERKLVNALGTKAPLPVEVVPFGIERTKDALASLGCTPALRLKDGKPFVTDNGNRILDCRFKVIKNPWRLEVEIDTIPGVVENGLFLGMAKRAIVATGSGVKIMEI